MAATDEGTLVRTPTLALATFTLGVVLALSPVAAQAGAATRVAAPATLDLSRDLVPAVDPRTAPEAAPGADPTAFASSDRISFEGSLPTSAGESPRMEPAPEAEAGRYAFVLIPLAAAAVIALGAVVVIARGRRRRRGD